MKITDNMNIKIKDYIGRMEGGVTTALSIIYDNNAYEGIYWYSESNEVITFPEELEQVLNSKVEDYEHYDKIKETLRISRADFNTIIDKLDSAI
jgi:hypothetical protein